METSWDVNFYMWASVRLGGAEGRTGCANGVAVGVDANAVKSGGWLGMNLGWILTVTGTGASCPVAVFTPGIPCRKMWWNSGPGHGTSRGTEARRSGPAVQRTLSGTDGAMTKTTWGEAIFGYLGCIPRPGERRVSLPLRCPEGRGLVVHTRCILCKACRRPTG